MTTTRRRLEAMTYRDLVKVLDREVSFRTRAEPAVKAGTPYISCFTCGKMDHWKRMDAGHYIGREYTGTRWKRDNLRPQCTSCNRYAEGRKSEFGLRLAHEGIDLVALQQKADLWGKIHPTEEMLIEHIEEARAENAKLREKMKGWKE